MNHGILKSAILSLGAAVTSLIISGCATAPNPNDPIAVQAYNEANDPLEPTNRYFFEVNRFVEEVLAKPLAGWYRVGVPDPAQDSVRNFLRNVGSSVTLANDLLQGDLGRAETTAMRFLINTTIGVGGLFDVASEFGYNYHEEDFGQTLAVHGVNEGPYLVLPLLGPSNSRDAVGGAVDNIFQAAFWLDIFVDDLGFLQISTDGAYQIDTYSRNMQALTELQRGSVDYYATLRSLYRQHRNDQINNGSDEPAQGIGRLPIILDVPGEDSAANPATAETSPVGLSFAEAPPVVVVN